METITVRSVVEKEREWTASIKRAAWTPQTPPAHSLTLLFLCLSPARRAPFLLPSPSPFPSSALRHVHQGQEGGGGWRLPHASGHQAQEVAVRWHQGSGSCCVREQCSQNRRRWQPEAPLQAQDRRIDAETARPRSAALGQVSSAPLPRPRPPYGTRS